MALWLVAGVPPFQTVFQLCSPLAEVSTVEIRFELEALVLQTQVRVLAYAEAEFTLRRHIFNCSHWSGRIEQINLYRIVEVGRVGNFQTKIARRSMFNSCYRKAERVCRCLNLIIEEIGRGIWCHRSILTAGLFRKER